MHCTSDIVLSLAENSMFLKEQITVLFKIYLELKTIPEHTVELCVDNYEKTIDGSYLIFNHLYLLKFSN